jgi:asparagine synthase (glutamine-hydrolysing)
LCHAFDDVIKNIFSRALEWCDGRQIVVPLSAGLDSRIIATTLKRLGYENVLCFAYGLPNNFESVKSKKVAEHLGFPWLHTEYSADSLHDALKSKEMREYIKFGCNGVSIPFIDDWVAIRDLRDKKLVDDDAVFMPGQSGDFIVGSHLRYLLDPTCHGNPKDIIGALLTKHFSLWEDIITIPEVEKNITERLRNQLSQWTGETLKERAAMYEYWEFHERQAKYCVNGGQVYDFFGYDWCMPLWDDEIIKFWQPISTELKMDSYLYRKYLATYDPYKLFQKDLRKDHWSREYALSKMLSKGEKSRSKRIELFLEEIPLIGKAVTFRKQHRKYKHFLKKDASGFPLAYGYNRYVWTEFGKRHHLSLYLNDVVQELYGKTVHTAVRESLKSRK